MDLGDEEEMCAALTRLALAGDGFFLGLSFAIIAIRTWVRFSFHCKALGLLKGTPSFPRIADLRQLLEDHCEMGNEGAHPSSSSSSSPSSSSSSSSSQAASSSLSSSKVSSSSLRNSPLVMVRGKVSTRSVMESQFFRNDDGLLCTENPTSEKGVIVQRTQTCLCNEWRGVFSWRLDWTVLLGRAPLREQTTISLRKVPFMLVDGDVFNFDGFAHIDMDESKHELPLTKVFHQLHPVQPTPYTLLQAIFGRGYPVGILDEEKILPIGKEITAVGILDRSKDGQPIIKSSNQLPYFLTELTREQLMIELAETSKTLLWSGIIIGSCAVGVLGYAFYRNWRRYKEWKLEQERQNEDERLSQEQMEGDQSDVPDGELCIICLQRHRQSAFLPCGHLVCCNLCARRVQGEGDSRCPVCRQYATSIVRIYGA